MARAIVCALLAAAVAKGASPEPSAAIDCAMRQFVFNSTVAAVPSALAGTAANAASFALDLGTNCSVPAVVQAAPQAPSHHDARPFEAAVNFYVAPGGDDSGPGSQSRPWATIGRCVQLLHDVPVTKRPGGVVFWIGDGSYSLDEPVSITPEIAYPVESSARIVFASQAGGAPEISGAARLEAGSLDWKRVRRNADNSTTFSALLPQSLRARVQDRWPLPFALRVNKTRFWPARYPNGDPTEPCDPFNKPPAGCPQFAEATGDVNPPSSPRPVSLLENTQLVVTKADGTSTVVATGSTYPLTAELRNVSVAAAADGHWSVPKPSFTSFNAHTGGQLDRYDQTYSAPFWASGVPMSLPAASLAHKQWKNVSGAHAHVFHSSGWGGWVFQLSDLAANGTMSFARGGFQEARGGGIRKGQAFFVSGLASELDAAGEFHVDPDTLELTVAVPVSVSIDDVAVELPMLESLVRITGSDGTADGMASGGMVSGVALTGLTFSGTLPTFMAPHEQPSGGDWAIHRGGAIFVANASRIDVQDCIFDAVEGNGVFLSQRVQDSAVTGNSFGFAGETPVAMQGSCKLMDCSQALFPTRINVSSNLMYRWGIWGKQAAAVYLSIARSNNIISNAAFVGPRAAYNINDGIGGGHTLKDNIAFGVVLQTSDHAPLNSWDRRPAFWPTVDPHDGGAPGKLSWVPDTITMRKNLIVRAAYFGRSNSIYALDNDDASSRWHHDSNVLYRGNIKFRDGLDKAATGNLILYPDYQQPYGIAFQVNGFSSETYVGNTLVTGTGVAYGFCADFHLQKEGAMPRVANNSYFLTSDDASWNNGGCGSKSALGLSEWQAFGLDVGSVVEHKQLSPAQLLLMAKSTLA